MGFPVHLPGRFGEVIPEEGRLSQTWGSPCCFSGVCRHMAALCHGGACASREPMRPLTATFWTRERVHLASGWGAGAGRGGRIAGTVGAGAQN